MAGVLSSLALYIVLEETALAQSLTAQQSLAIEGPTAIEFPENSGEAIATYRVTNATPGSIISWSIDGADARRLSIDGSGVLRFKAARNFEEPNDGNRDNEYEIDLSASDGSTQVSVEVAVMITDVNESPAFELESAEFSVEENASANRRVGGALAVIDPDDGDLMTFSLEGENADPFHIDAEGQIRVRPGAILDYETSGILSFTARVTDQDGLSVSLPVQIALTDADDPGIVTFLSARPFVGVPLTAMVSDQDGVTGRIRWRWYRATNTNDEFERIDGATGISYTPMDDDEGYILRVTVSYEDNFEVGASASQISEKVGRNAAPQFESASITLTVPEGAPAGTDVGKPVTATDSDDHDLTYALSGEDASYFEVNVSTGQIRVGAQALPDSETKASYTMIVTATDEARAAASVTVIITARVSNTPSVIIGPATVSYAENGTASVAMYTTTDLEGDGIIWGIEGTDAARFTINVAGELIFNSPPDYEKPRDANMDNVYELTATASDGNLTAELNVEVAVTNVNEAVIITGSASVTYAENDTTAVVVYSAIDSDGDRITWDVVGTDADWFSISQVGELTFNSPPDYEKPRDANNDNVYKVSVTASDGNLESTLNVEVTVTDVVEASAITGPATVSYAENGMASVAMYTTSDPNGDRITWDIAGVDAPRFSIEPTGELTFKSAPDYEKPRDANKDNVYKVMITASDGNVTARLDVEVSVSNVNEAALIDGATSVSYPENSIVSVAIYSATDPDGDEITWDVAGTDASRFSIKATGGLTFKSTPDYENPNDANNDNVYELTVTASDGNLESTLDVEVNVTNIDESTVITGPATVSYAENGMAPVALYTTTDPNGDGITWNIAGVDAPRFSIEPTGELTFKSAPDYEKPRDANKDNVYEVTVTATDGNLESTLDIEVTVANANEPVTITGSASVTYAENNATAVAVYSATDPDGDGIMWGVAGADVARFEVSETGELSFNSTPDYENPNDANKDNVYEVTIAASDGTLATELDIEVIVTNVNEAAIITGPATVTYAENGVASVATYTATDPDGEAIIWDVAGSDAAHFAIDSQGRLAFVSPPNFENPLDADADNTYLLQIVVNDSGNESSLDMVVEVADANDAPRFPTAGIVAEIPENSCPGTDIVDRGIRGDLDIAADEDGDPLTYALSGSDARHFVIHPPTGYVTLGPGALLDFETSQEPFLLRVSVSDGRDDFGNAESEFSADDYLDLTVVISDVDEPPVFTETQLILDACGTSVGHEPDQLRRVVTSGARGGSRVGAALSVKDPEGDPVHFRIVSQSDQGAFIVDSKTGQIMVAPGFSPRDARRVYTLRVAAMDGELESLIEVRIAVLKAPKPAPEPDVEDSSTPNQESADDAEAPTPVQSDEISGVSSARGENAAHSAPTPNTLNRPPVNLKLIEPTFVHVQHAVQIPLFGSSEAQDQSGRARLTALPGALAVPYQVRLTQDDAACGSLTQTAASLKCVCVSVEFFDVVGEPLADGFLNRPALLEIVLRTQDETGNSESGDQRFEIGQDSVEMRMRQDDEQKWGYMHASLREPADGSAVLMTRVRSPGQYMALVTESGSEREAPASAAPMDFVKTAVARQAQNTVTNNTQERTASFVYESVAVHPQSQPTPIVSAEPQVWRMARLLIALLLDVTVALSAGIFLQRITFQRQ